MKKVVLVNQSTGYLMIDIVNAYAKHYDEVVLLAGSIRVLERPLNEKVCVRHIMSYNRNSSSRRMVSWLWSSVQVFFLLLFKYRKFETIFVTNPPFAYLTGLILKRNFSVIVYDTYPDALKNIGISERNPIYTVWEGMNRQIFGKAENIFTLSESMALQLSGYVPKKRITVIPNWSGSARFGPVSREENPFIADNELERKFVVLYSGNIGYTHNVEVLTEVAEKLKEETDICFLFIGEGRKKEELVKIAKQKNLDNCRFMTWQSPDILPYSLSAADLGVVTLNDTTAQLSVPSKTYNLMAAGVALLSIAPETSALAQLIQDHKNGINFNAGQTSEIVDFILQCRNNRNELSVMSENSLKASKNYTYSNAELYLKS